MKKLHFKLPSLNRSAALKWLPRVTLSLSLIALGYTSFYLYQNVLIGVSDAIALESLSQQVLKVRLDVEDFESVNEDFLKKYKVPMLTFGH